MSLELEVMPSVPAAPDFSGLPAHNFDAMKVEVKDQKSVDLATKYRDDADDYIKRVTAILGPPTAAANTLHKWWTGLKAQMTAKATDVKLYNNTQLFNYHKKVQSDAAALERELQHRADAAAKAKRDAELADAMLFGGDVAAVEAAPLVIPQVTLGVSRVPGISTAKKPWSYEVKDMIPLLRAILNGDCDINAVQVNHTFMTEQARYYKGELSARYPGVNGVQDERIKR